MNPQIEKQILERRVYDADKRLAQLELVEKTVDPLSFRGQELLSERTDLRRIPDVAAIKLRALSAPPTPHPRQQAIDNAIAERTEIALAFIQKLEAAGDHAQARIWRLSLLDIPRDIMREF